MQFSVIISKCTLFFFRFKIIPPIRPNPVELKPSFKLEKCVVQQVSELKEITRLNFEDESTMTLRQYRKLAETFEKSESNFEIIENMFWEHIRKRRSNKARASCEIDPTYAIDNEQSLFPKRYPYFNLNEMSFNDSIIHRGDNIAGVNTPFLNFGMFATSFGFHHEDGNLASANVLHGGKPKVWISVPSNEAKKLEQYAQDNVPKKISCDLYIRHKATLIMPSQLLKQNIAFAKVSYFDIHFIVNNHLSV